MAIGIANKANNESVSNGFSTGSLSWTAGSRGIVSVASSAQSPGTVTGHTVTGGGVNWNVLGHVDYSNRRSVTMLLSDGTPSTGALTITAAIGVTFYEESHWSAEEITGFDTGTANDAAQTANTVTGAALNTPDLGTLDADDIAIFCSGFEDAGDDFDVAAGSTLLVKRDGGGGIRSLIVGYSTTDDTPGVTWTTAGNGAGIVGCIINAASGATIDPGVIAGSATVLGSPFYQLT